MKSIIYLTGFMSAGKSTLGPILANSIGWKFFDLDKEIEKRAGKSIVRMYSEDGEDYFRNLESSLLKELSVFQNTVISLGGGTILQQVNIDLMKSRGVLIYLNVSPEAAQRRLRFKRDRPALLFPEGEEPTQEQLLDRIKILYNQRKQYYLQADVIVDTDQLTIGKTIDKLIRILKLKRIIES